MPVRERLLIIGALFSFVVIGSAHACMPLPDYSSEPEYLREHADIVFVGRARVVTTDESRGLVSVRFRVTRVWKGSKRRVRNITTPIDQGACGLGLQFFAQGHRYLVYAHKNSSTFLTTSISGSKELKDADYDLERLGQGKRVS